MEPVFLIVNYLAKLAKMVIQESVNPATLALSSMVLNVFLIWLATMTTAVLIVVKVIATF